MIRKATPSGSRGGVVKSAEALRAHVRGLDGKDYGAYQSLKGDYQFPDFEMRIKQIPKDPYAPPHTGIYGVRLSHSYLGIPQSVFRGTVASTGYRDFLARRFADACAEYAHRRRGTGYSGVICIETPGQSVLDRNSVVFTDIGVEVRIFVGLPANGRRINAGVAETMLLVEVPAIVARAFSQVDPASVTKHIETVEDAEYLRTWLGDNGFVAFLADGAVLPRRSGTSDEPLSEAEAVVLQSPDRLRVVPKLPHAGEVTGMGIPSGVTLIVGGGFHGKSTLLRAIETGIYDHIAGDGRELCVSDGRAVKVRAYSGRVVSAVDISMFVGELPLGKDTRRFSTPNASGSTSQAASIVEALEMGARVLLMDEDTCAANLMVRDAKMQQLVKKEDEPIVVYLERARWLYEEQGVSSIIVLGGIGDYFAVADTVIQMTRYQPHDVSSAATEIANRSPGSRSVESKAPAIPSLTRYCRPSSIDPLNEYGKRSVSAVERNRIRFGQSMIDLTDVEQIVELSQTKAIAEAIQRCAELTDESLPLRELVGRCMSIIDEKGLDGLSSRTSGNLSRFRDIELALALNRSEFLRMEER
jgi:predicted ABC-class ATPase